MLNTGFIRLMRSTLNVRNEWHPPLKLHIKAHQSERTHAASHLLFLVSLPGLSVLSCCRLKSTNRRALVTHSEPDVLYNYSIRAHIIIALIKVYWLTIASDRASFHRYVPLSDTSQRGCLFALAAAWHARYMPTWPK